MVRFYFPKSGFLLGIYEILLSLALFFLIARCSYSDNVGDTSADSVTSSASAEYIPPPLPVYLRITNQSQWPLEHLMIYQAGQTYHDKAVKNHLTSPLDPKKDLEFCLLENKYMLTVSRKKNQDGPLLAFSFKNPIYMESNSLQKLEFLENEFRLTQERDGMDKSAWHDYYRNMENEMADLLIQMLSKNIEENLTETTDAEQVSESSNQNDSQNQSYIPSENSLAYQEANSKAISAVLTYLKTHISSEKKQIAGCQEYPDYPLSSKKILGNQWDISPYKLLYNEPCSCAEPASCTQTSIAIQVFRENIKADSPPDSLPVLEEIAEIPSDAPTSNSDPLTSQSPDDSISAKEFDPIKTPQNKLLLFQSNIYIRHEGKLIQKYQINQSQAQLILECDQKEYNLEISNFGLVSESLNIALNKTDYFVEATLKADHENFFYYNLNIDFIDPLLSDSNRQILISIESIESTDVEVDSDSDSDSDSVEFELHEENDNINKEPSLYKIEDNGNIFLPLAKTVTTNIVFLSDQGKTLEIYFEPKQQLFFYRNPDNLEKNQVVSFIRARMPIEP